MSAVGGFEEFFAERYESAVRAAFLLTYSRAAAEDIAQEALADMYQRWATIRQPDAYLWRALTNGARSWGRRRRRRRDSVDATAEWPVIADVIVVREALARLPLSQREALVLRHYLALTEREIADAMGCPIGTVKSHIHRGLTALKEALS